MGPQAKCRENTAEEDYISVYRTKILCDENYLIEGEFR